MTEDIDTIQSNFHAKPVGRDGGTAPGVWNEDESLSGRTRSHSPRRPVDLFVPKGNHTCTRTEYYEAKEA